MLVCETSDLNKLLVGCQSFSFQYWNLREPLSPKKLWGQLCWVGGKKKICIFRINISDKYWRNLLKEKPELAITRILSVKNADFVCPTYICCMSTWAGICGNTPFSVTLFDGGRKGTFFIVSKPNIVKGILYPKEFFLHKSNILDRNGIARFGWSSLNLTILVGGIQAQQHGTSRGSILLAVAQWHFPPKQIRY